jgi:hypothetical protein
MSWTTDSRALVSLMEELSEECWCAGWMNGLEYDLWGIVVGDRSADYGQWTVTPAQIADMKAFSERIGGWIVWAEGDRDDWNWESWRRIVPLDEWLPMYEQKRPRIVEMERLRNDPEEQAKHSQWLKHLTEAFSKEPA